jgi:surfactin synthase thioesterase subunit
VVDLPDSEWFISTDPRPDAQVRVVAFPSAGGGCAAFTPYAHWLPEWIELNTLNLPGRQARFTEPLRSDLEGLVTELVDACAQVTGRYLMFGYCSGALLAYLVACELAERELPGPRRLVVGSYPAPHRVRPPVLAELSSVDFWKVLIDNAAVPIELAAYVELRTLCEPVLRADFALVAGYRHRTRLPLPTPITVLHGEHDEALAPEDVSGWSECTAAGIDVRHVDAGHWFVEENPEAAMAALATEAATLLA